MWNSESKHFKKNVIHKTVTWYLWISLAWQFFKIFSNRWATFKDFKPVDKKISFHIKNGNKSDYLGKFMLFIWKLIYKPYQVSKFYGLILEHYFFWYWKNNCKYLIFKYNFRNLFYFQIMVKNNKNFMVIISIFCLHFSRILSW